jgi:hypothetical protein
LSLGFRCHSPNFSPTSQAILSWPVSGSPFPFLPGCGFTHLHLITPYFYFQHHF